MAKSINFEELNYITVDTDRYSGCYSRGQYTAWIRGVPTAVDENDMLCSDFWHWNTNEKNKDKVPYGKGRTPDEAILDLVKKYPYGPSLIYIRNTSIFDKLEDPKAFVVVYSERFVSEFPLSYAFLKEQYPKGYI